MTAATAQIAFRYRPRDSATGVTRTTAKRLAEVLGVDETQVIRRQCCRHQNMPMERAVS